jgi:hypothetical protein
MLFMLIKARSITLKVEVILKKTSSSSSKFDPFRIMYNELCRVSVANKEKVLQMMKQPPAKQDATKPDETARRQAKMNKPSNPLNNGGQVL